MARRDLARVAGQLGLLVYGLDGAALIGHQLLHGESWSWDALHIHAGRLQGLQYLAILLALAAVAASLSARHRVTAGLCAALVGVAAGHLALHAQYILIPLRADAPHIVAEVLSAGWVAFLAAGLAVSHLGLARPPHGGYDELARWVAVMVGPILAVAAVWLRARMQEGASLPDLTTVFMLGAGALYGWMQRHHLSKWAGSPHWSAPTLLLMRATVPAQVAYAWASQWEIPQLVAAALAVAATGALTTYTHRRRRADAAGADQEGAEHGAPTP